MAAAAAAAASVDLSPHPLTDLDIISKTPRRNWADLPEHLLVLIVERLFSAAGHITFSAVCRSWRSAAASVTTYQGPPLLFDPCFSLPCPAGEDWLVGRTICRFSSPAAGDSDDRRTYRSPISSAQIPVAYLAGCVRSHLIFIVLGRVVLADPFTGRRVFSPHFAYERYDAPQSFIMTHVVLTSSPESDSCMVLLSGCDANTERYSIRCWQPNGGGASSWSELVELNLRDLKAIPFLLYFRRRLFCLASLEQLAVVELEPAVSWRIIQIRMQCPVSPRRFFRDFSKFMVDCGEELLLVLYLPPWESRPPGPRNIFVYRLDTTTTTTVQYEWVVTKRLGDWCLFLDATGCHSFACPEPVRSKWGVRRNCVYIAGAEHKGWTVQSLDDEPIDDDAMNCRFLPLRRWPSPVWVYPKIHC